MYKYAMQKNAKKIQVAWKFLKDLPGLFTLLLEKTFQLLWGNFSLYKIICCATQCMFWTILHAFL